MGSRFPGKDGASKGANHPLIGANEQIRGYLTRNYGSFRRYLRARVRTEDDCDDVLHDFCLRVLRHSHQLRNPEAISSWMVTVLRTTLIDYYRRNAADRRCTESLRAAFSTPLMTERRLDEPVCSYVSKALPAIKPEYVEVIERLDFLGQPRKELAERLAISTNALTVRLFRARNAFKKELLPFCKASCDRYGTTCSWTAPDRRRANDVAESCLPAT